MSVLESPKHERWIQNMARGMGGGLSWTAAGFNATGASADACSSRKLKKSAACRARLDELQGRRVEKDVAIEARQNKTVTDIRDLARQHTVEAINTVVEIMRDTKALQGVRLAAALALHDRGHGKAVQHIEVELSVYDSLSLADKQALLDVIDGVLDRRDGEVEGNPERLALTHH